MKMIVAVDENWSIGNENKLLAHLPSDLKRFKKLTEGNVVVMGRKTLESLPDGKPLPNRLNVVVTTDEKFEQADIVVSNSLDNLKAELFLSEIMNGAEIFIIGGQSVYEQCIDDVDTIYVTKIHHEFKSVDAFFPNLDESNEWQIVEESKIYHENGLDYVFTTYARKDV